MWRKDFIGFNGNRAEVEALGDLPAEHISPLAP